MKRNQGCSAGPFISIPAFFQAKIMTAIGENLTVLEKGKYVQWKHSIVEVAQTQRELLAYRLAMR